MLKSLCAPVMTQADQAVSQKHLCTRIRFGLGEFPFNRQRQADGIDLRPAPRERPKIVLRERHENLRACPIIIPCGDRADASRI